VCSDLLLGLDAAIATDMQGVDATLRGDPAYQEASVAIDRILLGAHDSDPHPGRAIE
jgi:hypothetical protein